MSSGRGVRGRRVTLQDERLLGSQVPSYCSVPEFAVSMADEAAELMRVVAGIELDEAQRLVLEGGLGMRKRRGKLRWSAFEVAVIEGRQNGKNVILEARELAGLLLFEDRLILHTAHQYKTSQEAFRQIDEIVAGSPLVRRELARVTRTNGEEAFEFKNGGRLRFLARSKASGRGFTADCLILDEAFKLGAEEMAALLPTMSARPNPQIWSASSAGDQDSEQLGRIWRRGRRAVDAGKPDAGLAFYEWAADLCTVFCSPGCTVHDRPEDPRVWAKTNPAFGTRIDTDFIVNEMATMPPSEFARERLSVGDYPPDGDETWAVVPKDRWDLVEDGGSRAVDPVAFAVEVGPERRSSAIGTAGLRGDGRLHVEVIEHRHGTDWVPARMAELARRWRPCAIVMDPGSHAGALIEATEQLGVEVVRPFTSRDAAAACSQFYDAVMQKDLRHMGTASDHGGALTSALAGARTRPLGDAWAWDRKHKTIDISPLTAVTLAAWGFNRYGRSRIAPYDMLKSVG